MRVAGGDERLGEEDRLAHLRDSELAAFLDGGLSPSERHRVEAHIDICNVCRAELVEVGRAIEQPDRQANVATVPRSRRWWIPAAAAAGIVAILVVPRLTTRPPATDGQTRAARVVDAEGQRHIDVISPADDVTLPVSQMAFAWHAVAADVYRISLLTQTGDSIWAQETTDTTATVPTTVSLTPGRAYFWRVDALGNGIVATTKAHPVQVSR